MTSTLAAADLQTLRARRLPALAATAAGAADRERHRRLPHAAIRDLADQGLFTWRIPEIYGGPGADLSETINFVIDLATADANIAQAVRVNFVAVESHLLATGPQGERDRETWFARLLDGAVLGNAGNEIGGRNGAVATTITHHGDHHLVTGRKFYSTGALFADWIQSTAIDEAGVLHAFSVRPDRAGIELIDDWDAMGQRLTVSGTTVFTGLRLEPHEVRALPTGDPERRPALSPLFQVYLAGVQVGIATSVVAEARTLLGSPSELDRLDHRVAAARSGILTAALAVARAYDAGAPHDLLVDAATEVAMAQFYAINTAITVSDQVIDVLDRAGVAAPPAANLDRHWRNARTLAGHSPRAYKASMVGRYLLTGEQVPTSGLF